MEKNYFLSFVGSNPVPVYVAAKYLTTANRNDIDSLPLVEKILFIHSNDTENNCTQTKKVLDLPQECFFSMSIGTVDKTRSPSAIRQCIIEMLDRFVSNMDSIIFCYTAGTKPMSVFGYNTVQEYCLKHNKQFYYCDLDPNNYKIIAGNPNEESERLIPYEGNLLDKVKIELENLLLIQNIIKRKEKESKDEISISRKIIEESYFFNKEQVFINLYESLMSESHELESLIKDLDRRSIFKKGKKIFPLKKDKDFINGMPKLTNMNAEQLFDPAIAKYIDGPELWRDKEKAKAIKDQFNSCFKRINEKYGIKTEPSDYTFNRLIQIKDTLHGKWLEYYLYEIAKELRLEEPDLFDEVYLSVEAYPNGEPENKCFEIDLVFIKGYRLILVSVTTATPKHINKQKAFEAFFRARQIGGDEANSCLISMAKNNTIQGVETDMQTFDGARTFSAYGAMDLCVETGNQLFLNGYKIKAIYREILKTKEW